MAVWLAAGLLLAGAGLLFSSMPAIAKLMAGGFLLAGFCCEWRHHVSGTGLGSVRQVRWETHRWRLRTQSGCWLSAVLLADRCRFLWGVKLCWLDENGSKRSALFFRSRRSGRRFRRFRVRLKLADIA
ncbi:MAG: hypothetical protein IIA05_07415 [Proteobacteria bacterium]|nr:hypothetical protein [Pseudomonadota bacterium]